MKNTTLIITYFYYKIKLTKSRHYDILFKKKEVRIWKKKQLQSELLKIQENC